MFDGKGSERQLEQDTPCPKCEQKGVYFTGSSVLHGNPFSPAADTEIEHDYECSHCQHEGSRRT